MHLLSIFNKRNFLLRVIYDKYACVIPLKDKKNITITILFKIEVKNMKKYSEFYNRSIKSWLKKWYRNVFNI